MTTSTYASPGVYIRPEESGPRPIQGVGTSVAAFVGFTERAPTDPEDEGYDARDPQAVRPRRVTSWTAYQRLFGGFVRGAVLPYAVYAYFANGGGSAYVVRVPAPDDGDDGEQPAAAVPSATRADQPVLRFRTLALDSRVEVEVGPTAAPAAADEPADAEQAGDEGGPQRPGDSVPDSPSGPTFTVVVRADGEQEVHEGLTVEAGPRNVVTALESSRFVRADQLAPPEAAAADLVPSPGTYRLASSAPAVIGSGAFAGVEADRTGINGLTIADDVTMVAVPDLVTAARREDGSIDLEMWRTVQTALIDHCDRVRSRLAILDAPPDMAPQRLSEWRVGEARYDSAFAALYYPWLLVPSRAGEHEKTVAVPPCGHVAGVWARSDALRGVHKAPANEVLRDVLDVQTPLTKGDQDLLNPDAVNCIRPFGVRGIRVWGARTLSSRTEWRYVNVRRLFTYVEQSLERGTQWVVFEPNGPATWQRVKRSITAFLLPLWESGALAGATPEQAFFVKCDEENNPPSEAALGVLHIEVYLAASRPAEFVVVHISQLSSDEGGGAS